MQWEARSHPLVFLCVCVNFFSKLEKSLHLIAAENLTTRHARRLFDALRILR